MLNIAIRCLLAAVFAAGAAAQNAKSWSEPFPPHRIAGNLYYVGTRGLASYLITTPEGHILINSGLESSVPLIESSITQLGFRFADVRILLISHAHWDHNAGSALVKQRTGARYEVMEPDVAVTEDGGRSDFFYRNSPRSFYPPAKVDRALQDGDQVKLGGTVLTAHLTPGHTKGCTTWTMQVTEAGRTYDAVIVGSVNVNAGFQLVRNSLYPGIAQDFQRTFATLKALHCDIFLGAHGDYYGLEGKFARLPAQGVKVFIDPAGYSKYVTEREQSFLHEWQRQKR
ncbi:subclass B3 metallo-beta-lactamase [Paludibaculum fermentans]|uniref:Subclass B3 metallo-beta-lactamase n=1 Tax=Paludibaculum fermentans TaxID=1473598 RepID=A0A7S7NUT2_PALFE|nr:subclass B3 metallo-beta-lactamase [Paludibaculum fermentans]QOY90211.1 subclass B3 metallo-beta-lactamase [Paludibaculum fermentans]